jgi:hypothetical protein
VHRHAAARKTHRTLTHAHHRLAPARHASSAVRPAPPVVASHAAPRAAPAHNNGVVLALGALVLLVLVAASLALLRLANRLQREIMGSAA